MTPLIGLTMGDPAGIGPEIVLKALAKPGSRRLKPVIFGDIGLLEKIQRTSLRRHPAARLALVGLQESDLSSLRPGRSAAVPVVTPSPLSLTAHRFGRPMADMGRASGAYIKAAVNAAQSGRIRAIVTAPIHKKAFHLGGWGRRYVGHTEMLAGLTQTKNVALMLAVGDLRAVHVTSHIPLHRVAAALSKTRIRETVRLALQGMADMGIRSPRVGVAALNPHAGENGLLGREESRLIAPVVNDFRKKGHRVEGPISADVLWPLVLHGRYDVGVAMYHDQGQIAVKLLGFGLSKKKGRMVARGVNVTLGLPFVRTSVAHGTAYDIAGKGIASEHSLLDAIDAARALVRP